MGGVTKLKDKNRTKQVAIALVPQRYRKTVTWLSRQVDSWPIESSDRFAQCNRRSLTVRWFKFLA
jgi:hypothetical protein